jgi:hypothetical protein
MQRLRSSASVIWRKRPQAAWAPRQESLSGPASEAQADRGHRVRLVPVGPVGGTDQRLIGGMGRGERPRTVPRPDRPTRRAASLIDLNPHPERHQERVVLA